MKAPSRAVAHVVAVALTSCGGGSAEPSAEPTTLRVAAASGLSEFEPTMNASGATAAALDLVWMSARDVSTDAVLDGSRINMRPSGKYDAETLAGALSFPGLVATRVEADGTLTAEFETGAIARAFLDAGGFDLGPFEVESQDESRVLLRSRGGTALARIALVHVPLGDQWRRLLGHQIDVIPATSSIYEERFAGLRSVRVAHYPLLNHTALVFNTHSEVFAEAAARRAMARRLDRGAIAAVACGKASCAVTSWSPTGPSAVAIPAHQISVHVVAGRTDMVLAARVLRHQLGAQGIDVRVAPVSIDRLARELYEGRWEMAVLPMPADQARLSYRFSARGAEEGVNVCGYSSPEFEAAFARGEASSMQAILARDVPYVPLYEMREIAAIDARFCGGELKDRTSWLWLADLHPCAEGEAP